MEDLDMRVSTEWNLSRRQLLQQSAAAGSLALSSSVAFSAEENPFPIVDTHTHFYNPERKEGVPWPGKDDKLLYRPVLPAEFVKLTKPLGVTGTIVVEASPWLEDNQWLLDLAKDESSILGVIGNVKPGGENARKQLQRFARNRLFRGIRINVGDLKKGLAQDGYLRDLTEVALLYLTLDVNGGPDTPAVVAELAKKIPSLPICINHCGNVKIDGKKPPAEWLAGMEAAAKHEHVYCKVSALVEGTGERTGDAPRNVDFYRPVLDALWKIWGEDRLIYGSNWPVSVRFASYETVLGIVRDYFGDRSRTAQEKFFAGNAHRAYRWPLRKPT